jgi:hypothetical protein
VNELETYPAVYACSLAILSGRVLQASGVSVGHGKVIDWRTVPSGEMLESEASAADCAQLFVALVGPDMALASARVQTETPQPKIVTFGKAPHADGHRRQFTVGRFTVKVEPHDADADQESFTRELARLAASIESCGE